MATGRLSRPTANEAPAPRSSQRGAEAPWFAPIARGFEATDPRVRGVLDLAALNERARAGRLRTASGRAIRFVDACDAPAGAYERVVHDTGCVPSRTSGDGMLHDWFNALAWLAFPRAKARLNEVHATALAAADAQARTQDPNGRASVRGRGAARDAATLFDESGAVLVCADPRLRDAFVARDWNALFVHRRTAFVREAKVVVFGHALFEKLLDPYKTICAQTVVLARADADDATALDGALASLLRADALAQGLLHPLPLMGVPGWCDANEDAAFYDDPHVFRSERRRKLAETGPAR